MGVSPARDPLQLGVSAFYDEAGPDDFVGVGLDVQNHHFEVGVNTSFDSNRFNLPTVPNSMRYSQWFLGGYAGLRQEIRHHVYGAIGGEGVYSFLSGDWQLAGFVKAPYVVGPYVGLEYQPEPYLQMFIRIMPYSYVRTDENSQSNSAFHDGQVGIKYFFL